MNKKIKESDQIKVHVVNVGYDVKGTDVIVHLVWRPVYPREYSQFVNPFWYDDEKRRSVGVAKLQPGDTFDLKKGQRIALAKAETAAYGELVKEVKDSVAQYMKGLTQAGDFLAKATRVKEGNKRYVQRVDSGEIK